MTRVKEDHETGLLRPAGDVRQRVGDNKRILALKLDHIGDLAISFPAFRLLRSTLPDYEITLICGRWNVALAEAAGYFNKVIPYDYFAQNPEVDRHVPQEPVAELLARLSPPYGIAIDMRVDPETRPLLRHIDAAVKCGVDAFRRFPFLDIVLPTATEGDWRYSYATPAGPAALMWTGLKLMVPQPVKASLKPPLMRIARLLGHRPEFGKARAAQTRLHNAEHLLLLVHLIGHRMNPAPESLGLGGLDAKGGLHPKTICIAPLGNSSLRRWPLEYFAELIDLFMEHSEYEVVLLGTAEQRETIRRIVPANNERVRLEAGNTSLLDAVQLLKHADIFIGNDSGLAHLAAAVGAPVIAIFSGSIEFEEFGPRGPHATVLAANVSCRGCRLLDPRQCLNGLACVRSITPQDVFDEALRVLAR